MKSIWLIANSRSGSTDEGDIEQAQERIAALGATISRFIDMASEDLPTLDDTPPDIIAALGGDGTANAVIERYGRKDCPPLLILPGGTMNLLAKKLHGEEADREMVLDKALNGGATEAALPMLKGPDFTSLVGIIAGPATAWGEVREHMRDGAIDTIIEKVRTAISQTLDGQPIRLEETEGEHGAIFIEPEGDGLHAHAVRTERLGDLAAHGWAWLNRDFLGGPTENLMRGKKMTLTSENRKIGLLVDGERRKANTPLVLEWSECPARFLATNQG